MLYVIYLKFPSTLLAKKVHTYFESIACGDFQFHWCAVCGWQRRYLPSPFCLNIHFHSTKWNCFAFYPKFTILIPNFVLPARVWIYLFEFHFAVAFFPPHALKVILALFLDNFALQIFLAQNDVRNVFLCALFLAALFKC